MRDASTALCLATIVLVSLPSNLAAARGVALSAAGSNARSGGSLSTAGNQSTGDPALDYTLHCQGCHRADGSATPDAVPPLTGSMARFLTVDGGRDYLARVPGVAQSLLDDAALAALLNWMLRHFDPEHVPAAFRPYEAVEIGALRGRPLVEPRRVRTQLLGAMSLRP